MYEDFISERLAKLRIQRGVSARDMSLSLGQANNYINNIENKKSLPSMQSFFYICEYLGVTPAEFFDDSSQNPVRLATVLDDLKRLDPKTLELVSALIKQLADTRRS